MAADPYVPKQPGDIIRAGDWNEMQSKARDEIYSHTHTGGDKGTPIPRGGIAPKAIDGSLIDPEAEATLKSLTTTDLKIKGAAILGDIPDLMAMVKGLDSNKLNRAGDTISGSLTIQQDLTVNNSVTVKKDLNVAGGVFRILSTPQDASGHVLDLGPSQNTTAASLRLGFHDSYAWIQSHNLKPLAINPLGNNVDIGTTAHGVRLTVYGEFVRKIWMATGLGPVDDTDSGQIVSRVLKFTKYYAGTALRILYCDNLRVTGQDASARWEIRIDGKAPPGGAIVQDKYGNTGNYHEPATILGYAEKVDVGEHKIEIWVTTPVPGYPNKGDAYTGWLNSRWTLEAQEVWL
jgi:hypothetical protein